MKFLSFLGKQQQRIYLDYAAATPVDPAVLDRMRPYWREEYGNAGGIHKEGQHAAAAVRESREKLARMLHVQARDVTFTSGGTESNNLAIRGAMDALRTAGRAYADMEILTTQIEHPSILEVVRSLGSQGVGVKYLRTGSEGRIDVSSLKSTLSAKTVLVSCAYVNSEVGTVEDVKRLTRLVKKYNMEWGTNALVHIDASQAPLWLPCQMDALGADMLTLDAGKCYGPKGSGALIHRHQASLVSVDQGGAQEAGFRPGTENTPLIIGGVASFLRAQSGWALRSERVVQLRDHMIAAIESKIPEAMLNGPRGSHRVANNINISIPGFDSEYAVIVLDREGIAASTRSACGSSHGPGSSVVRNIADEARASSTIRFTLGEETTKKEIDAAVAALRTHIDSMRAFAGSSRL